MHDRFREQRKYARLALEFNVLFKRLDKQDKTKDEEFIQGKGKNISSGGILLTTDLVVVEGERIILHIFLEGKKKEPFIVIGQVVYVHDNTDSSKTMSYGIAFEDFTFDQVKRFMKFCFSKMYEKFDSVSFRNKDKKENKKNKK